MALLATRQDEVSLHKMTPTSRVILSEPCVAIEPKVGRDKFYNLSTKKPESCATLSPSVVRDGGVPEHAISLPFLPPPIPIWSFLIYLPLRAPPIPIGAGLIGQRISWALHYMPLPAPPISIGAGLIEDKSIHKAFLVHVFMILI
jgi:hypothetical protein